MSTNFTWPGKHAKITNIIRCMYEFNKHNVEINVINLLYSDCRGISFIKSINI